MSASPALRFELSDGATQIGVIVSDMMASCGLTAGARIVGCNGIAVCDVL